MAEWQGDKLGVYDRAGSHAGHLMWRQRDTADKGAYLYFSEKWNNWNISPQINGGSGLQNQQSSYMPPIEGDVINEWPLTDVFFKEKCN